MQLPSVFSEIPHIFSQRMEVNMLNYSWEEFFTQCEDLSLRQNIRIILSQEIFPEIKSNLANNALLFVKKSFL